MRIVRFLADDSRTLIGEDHGDGTATVLLDAEGILGPPQLRAALRAVLRGCHAMVADDDEMIRRTVASVLSRFDCECIECADGAEAMDTINSRSLDLVVSDIVMPHHDGYEIFEAARTRSESLPVVLITGFGYDPNHTIVRATERGLDGVLMKPFSPDQLLHKIGDAMRPDEGPASSLVATDERVPIGRILAPLSPREIFVVEDSMASEVRLSMRPLGAVRDPRKPVVLDAACTGDIRCRPALGAVIGARARRIAESDVASLILGYVSALDVQCDQAGPFGGPGFETSLPIGPAVVGPDALDETSTLVVSKNGTEAGSIPLPELLAGLHRAIVQASRWITLAPGSVVLATQEQGLVVQAAPDDELTVEIKGVGGLTNRIVRA